MSFSLLDLSIEAMAEAILTAQNEKQFNYLKAVNTSKAIGINRF